MKTAKDFKQTKTSPIDGFIEKEIYPHMEGTGRATIYINVIQMENIDLKQLKDRLKELGFSIGMGKEGVDDVLHIMA